MVPVSDDASQFYISLRKYSRLWPVLPLCLSLLNCGCGQNASTQGKKDFAGRTLVVQGKYKEAIPVLKEYLRDHRRGKFASRAGLFPGKAHLGLEQFETAKQAFQKTTSDYPNSLEAHKSRYKLAIIALLQDQTDGASRQFQQLSNRPDGPLAAEAMAFAAYLRKRNQEEGEAD